MNRIAYILLAITSASAALGDSHKEQPLTAAANAVPSLGKSEEATSQQFEYHIESSTPRESEQKTLNRLGLEGWELVAVLSSGQTGPSPRTFYFKRVKARTESQPVER